MGRLPRSARGRLAGSAQCDTVNAVNDPVPITASLDSMMSSLRGTDRVQIGGVFGRWNDAVGDNVAAHVRPVRLDQRVLTVEVDQAAWATQVRFLGSTIIARLHEAAGVDIDRLKVRVARGPASREGPGRSV